MMNSPILDLLPRCARALAIVLLAFVGALAPVAAAAPQDAEAVMQIPEDEPVARGSDTPRNAAYTFIVLSRDGEWADAADMLQKPEAGWPAGLDVAERWRRTVQALGPEQACRQVQGGPSGYRKRAGVG